MEATRGRRQKDVQRHRRLTLSIVRVEVRLYRRSRTSSDILPKPAHFQYILRCQFSGSPQESSPYGYWWDDLPSSYDIRRKWGEIGRVHEELARWTEGKGLTECAMPNLPHCPDVNTWLKASEDERSDLHYLYVTNRLVPYFANISAILHEIPPTSLCDSKAFRLFVTAGPTSLQRAMPNIRLGTPELQAAARSLKQSQSWKDSQNEGMHRREDRAEDRRSHAARTGDPADKRPDAEDSGPRLAASKIPHRPGISHYNFFATTLPPQALGTASGRELCLQMGLKERREMAHRAFYPLPSDKIPQRKPGHSQSSPALVSTGKATLANEGLASMLAGRGRVKATKLEMMQKDLCVGLRTLILNEDPPEVLRGKRKLTADFVLDDRKEGSHIETLMVYRMYRKLLEEDGSYAKLMSAGIKDPTEESSSSEEDDDFDLTEEEKRGQRHERERLAYIEDLGVPRELMPVSWTTIFLWIEREYDFADEMKKKSCCMSTLKACKDWRQFEASVAQSYLGVSLNMLFQWVWPSAAPKNVAKMLSWIGQLEFEKIKQPTPEVIPTAERLQLEAAFIALDANKCGYINAEDIAGRPGQTPREAARNLVEVDTVREVYGRGPIDMPKFLDIMCQDNFRGHEGSTMVMLEDARRLILSKRELIGCCGWVFRDAPQSEEHQRRLINAIEAEVKRWKSLERLRISTPSAHEVLQDTFPSSGPNAALECMA